MHNPIDPTDVQKLLREIDETVLVTAAGFAQHVGVSYDSWRSWRIGRRNPSAKNLLALAAALDARAEAIGSLAERASQVAERYASSRSERSTRTPS